MGKKVREYKSGDFIFAKVKGYPAWPARVQRPNGKKYFVYFYGTGETANLPPNMIFDYAENKDKFLTKTVKRRDFNDGVKQIEYDFANNVPLEEVIGVPAEVPEGAANDTANDSALDTTLDESVADTTANDTVADDANATQTDAAVEDSDEAGTLVIDEGKTPSKGRKGKADPKIKETPKPAKTPRGKQKKEESKEKEEEKIDEELVSRSGRKIRPKRYMDEQTEENATLPSPAPKKRRASPVGEKEKVEPPKEKETKNEKTFTEYNVVKQSELEGLKKPFEPAAEEDKDKENILIAYLAGGAYAGVRVFQSRPAVFKSEAARLQWDKQAARNALTLKMQLEREQITPQSVAGQLVMELNLTDEEKATLDKERETEEKKSRVNFLKTEMKLIELDAKIKTCLCLEKADTELCLKLLDDLLGLEVKPLMLLKHPTCLETVKRMRAYVGNTPSWDLSEQDALHFSKQAHHIRKKADALYKNMKEHFQTPEGLSFWEYFSERVLTFKRVTANLNAGELLELVHEPIELSQPNAHNMRSAIEEANNSVPPLPDTPEMEEDKQIKKKPAAKSKKPPAAPAPAPSKSRRTRHKPDEEPDQKAEEAEDTQKENGEEKSEDAEELPSQEHAKEPETTPVEPTEDVEMAEPEKAPESEPTNENTEKEQEPPEASDTSEKNKKQEKATKDAEKSEKSSKKDKRSSESVKDNESVKSDSEKSGKSESEKSGKSESEKSGKSDEKKDKKNSKEDKNTNNIAKGDKKESDKNSKESDKSGKEKEDKSEEKPETEKSDDKDKDEPRAKRSRESKKTEPPPRSPAKRKSKF